MVMIKKHNNYIIAFLLPLLFAAIGLALAGIYPFHGKSMASSDILMQYMPMAATA